MYVYMRVYVCVMCRWVCMYVGMYVMCMYVFASAIRFEFQF